MSLSTLTAAELYEAIWSTPLSHLAIRWRVNAHALGQLIDRVGMPRPKSGYWTQKALGKPLAVSAMPKFTITHFGTKNAFDRCLAN